MRDCLTSVAEMERSPIAFPWKVGLCRVLTVKLDTHFTALWDHGHIKFWSKNTLQQLLKDTGFRTVEFRRVGRIPCLAKSMIAIARK